MPGTCTHPDCGAPRRKCLEGEMRLSSCTHWSDDTAKANAEEIDARVTWSGYALGTREVHLLAARARAVLLGVIGAHDAGKTTFLATLYLHFCRGNTLSDLTFAGSHSLQGWEQRAHYLRWPPSESGTAFPPHTSTNITREASLLHFSFRHMGGQLEEVFLTDAPGEWFKQWTINESAEAAKSARWIARYASSFVLFADCEALSGEHPGVAREVLLQLIHRLGSVVNGRPVAFLWSKADLDVPKTTIGKIRTALERELPLHKEFSVSVYRVPDARKESLSSAPDIVDWLLHTRPERYSVCSVPVQVPEDAFLAYRF